MRGGGGAARHPPGLGGDAARELASSRLVLASSAHELASSALQIAAQRLEMSERKQLYPIWIELMYRTRCDDGMKRKLMACASGHTWVGDEG